MNPMPPKVDRYELAFDDNDAYEKEKAIYKAAAGLTLQLLEHDDEKRTLYVRKSEGQTLQEVLNKTKDEDVQQSILCACLDDLLKFQNCIRDLSLPEWDGEKYRSELAANLQWLREHWGRIPKTISDVASESGPITLRNTHGDYRTENILVVGERRYITNFRQASRSPVVLDILKLTRDYAADIDYLVRLSASSEAYKFDLQDEEWEFRFFSTAEHIKMARRLAELKRQRQLSLVECRQEDACNEWINSHFEA